MDLKTILQAIKRFRKALSKADRTADKLRDRILLRRIDKSAKLLLVAFLLSSAGCRTSSVRFLESDGIHVPWYERVALNMCDGVSRLNVWVGEDREDD